MSVIILSSLISIFICYAFSFYYSYIYSKRMEIELKIITEHLFKETKTIVSKQIAAETLKKLTK